MGKRDITGSERPSTILLPVTPKVKPHRPWVTARKAREAYGGLGLGRANWLIVNPDASIRGSPL